ncbi:MAG: xanthine dehydrogenase accessory protein XdhC [Bdellovibrionales bacterium]|nr:xanthine dehydrogenase accessory protein XdhC [Bdellovibrionales bacterium]
MEINSKYLNQAMLLNQNGVKFVTVSITSIKGSAPQDIGAKMIVTKKGLDFGTVGGGKVEAHCINYAKDLLLKDSVKSISTTWNLQKDIGMTCGGEVSFFFEVLRPVSPWQIVIFGAGHISQELSRLLLRLDCNLTVVDNRKEWLEKIPNNQKLTKIYKKEMSEALDVIDDKSYIALMTMGHSYDVPIIYEALKNYNFPYLAVIGSASKKIKIKSELKDKGLSDLLISKMICPIGEKIGSNHPAEIAVSVTAQLLKYRNI